MSDFVRSAILLFMLLNPFLLVVYLIDAFEKLSRPVFVQVILRAGIFGMIVFWVFALLGDFIFHELLQAEFASFQIFGGVIFLIIGVRFVFRGNSAIEGLRGESGHIAGAIAMPLMIGPGTISASILAGKRLDQIGAVLSILLAVGASLLVIVLLKSLHDYVRPRNEALVERYIEITGRITALVVGTFAIDMIMNGLQSWLAIFG